MGEHEVTFVGVEKTRDQRLTNAQGTAIGIAKLIERARHGDAADANSNTSCALMWARLLVAELEAVPPADRNRTME